MKNGDQPAYPVTEETTDRIDAGIAIYTGLTKREYFAAMAMQALVTRGENYEGWSENHSKQAIHIADSLLNQLEKEDK